MPKLFKYSWNLNLKKQIDAEIVILVQKAIDGGIIDEFSDGSFLDKYIHCQCQILRNNIRKEQLYRHDFIESWHMCIENDLIRLQKELALIISLKILTECIEQQKYKINIVKNMLSCDLQQEDKKMFDQAMQDIDVFEMELYSKTRQMVKNSVCGNIYKKKEEKVNKTA